MESVVLFHLIAYVWLLAWGSMSVAQENLRQHIEQPKKLALFFIVFPPPSADEELPASVYSQLLPRIARALKVPEHHVALSKFSRRGDGVHYVTFGIHGEKVNVVDSEKTPKEYNRYKELWRTQLKSSEFGNSVTVSGRVLFFDPEEYEAVFPDGREAHASNFGGVFRGGVSGRSLEAGSGDAYVEGENLIVNSVTERSELTKEILSRPALMELPLKSVTVADFENDYGNFHKLLDGLMAVASDILEVEESAIVLVAVKENPTVAQFTVYPASKDDVSRYLKDWRQALDRNASILNAYFPDDFGEQGSAAATITKTVATVRSQTTTGQPEATTQKASGKGNTGLVVGSVVAGLAAAIILGGGGYACAKRKQQAECQAVAKSGEDFAERSPGGGEISPDGLTNVNVHGENTPNPHNFRG